MIPYPIGPLPARIMLVDECLRKADIESGKPFSGYVGIELGKMLGEAGIQLASCYTTWAVRQRSDFGGEDFFASKKKDITQHHSMWQGKPTMSFVLAGIETLVAEINSCQPSVIVAFGNTAMFALTGEWGIGKWRGSTLDCTLPGLSCQPKVVPCYPPGRVLANWEWRPIAIMDLKRAVKASVTTGHLRPDYKFLTRPSFGTAMATLDMLYSQVLRGPLKLACDIETRSYNIACIQLAWSNLDAICIPLMCVERASGYWAEDEETRLMFRMAKILTHENCQLVGQYFHYDAQYFQRFLRYLPNLVRDTLIAQHSCFSSMDKSLDFLSSMYCEYHTYWKGEGKDWTADMDEDQLWVYGCKDAVITYEVDTAQQASVKRLGLEAVHDFQQKLFWPVLETMIRGLDVNKSLRATFAMTLFEEIATREQWLIDLLDEPLNIRSTTQMQGLFYDQLKQKPILNRKTKAVSCDDEALRTIAEREPILRVLCRKIAELRSLGVFLSTFIKAPLDHDGKMRCSFNIGGTETYRFSSSKNAFGSGLNLQNIPNGGGDSNLELPNVRTLFCPRPGWEFFDIDLSAADLRIVVWESDCREMKAMLREGKDPYTEIAKEFYNDPTIGKKDPRRQTFKSFAHGTNYLGTAKGLAERLGLSVKEAEKTQAWYFGKFPEILKWQEGIKNQVNTRRMVRNVFGYRNYIFQRIEGTLFNQVVAWIPQSTVACLINRIYVNIYNNLRDVEVLVQVHDSLAGQYPIAIAERCRAQIIEQAQILLPYGDDPMIIPVGIKTSTKSWGDCK